MKKNNSSLAVGLGVKKITAKIDTGRKRVVTGTLTTTISTNISSTTSSTLNRGIISSAQSTASSTSTFPRSQKGNQSRPCQPSKDPNIRAFVQANARVSNMTALFHDEVDTQNLSAPLVKNARKSGVLNLSGRNLTNVPMKVWRINELDENERSTVSVALDDNTEDKWWEFVDLQKLIIANNYIKDIPCDIGNLLSLQTFDAHDNQIIAVSKDLGTLSNLSKLDLSHNELNLLPEEIGQLKRLAELKISHNSLEEIPSTFGNLSSLRILDVSHNKLTSFPGDLCFLSFLQTLNLSNNKIKELPEEIGSLAGLRTLDCSENCLKSCPKGISELVHLEILYMHKNKLEQIPDVSKAKNLKEIHLQSNLIREFESEKFRDTKVNLIDLRLNKIDNLRIDWEDLELLERLYLENNDISQLPDDLALLPLLKSLTLDGNPIRGIRLDIIQRGTQEILKYLKGKLRLSESSDQGHGDTRGISPARSNGTFASPPRKSPSRRKSGSVSAEELGVDPYKCKTSRSLILSSRQIRDIEDNVFQLAADSSVTCVDLSKNQISVLPNSIDLCYEWLVELKLDFNRLNELPSSISKCSRLQYLTAQNNQLVELPNELSHLKSLREVNLGYNKFDTIPGCLYEIPSVEILNFASNKIDKLEPENLEKLKRLAVLDVRNNNIAIMPGEIGLLTQLKSLSIEGNAFRVPNYQIISQGTDSILAYLRNRIIK